MNRKLVALGFASACALPLAAQAQTTGSVTLYGRMNLNLELVNGETCSNLLPQPNNGLFVGGTNSAGQQVPAVGNQIITNCPAVAGGTKNPTVNRISSNTSRFGMRGVEPLYGGLNAVFQIETNIGGDTGNSPTSGFASRETYVGLQGFWGRLVMGKFVGPVDDLHPIFGDAPTFLTSILSTVDVWAQGNLNAGQGGMDARTGNNIRYDTPNWNGLTLAAQYSTHDDSGNTTQTPYGGDNGDHTTVLRHAWIGSFNIIYSNGPFQAAAAAEWYRKIREYNAVSGTYNGQSCTAVTQCILDANDSDWMLAGAYDFGTVFQGVGLRVAGIYESTRYQTPSGSLKRNFWGVSGTLPIGGGKVYVFYGKTSNGTGSATDGETVGYVVRGSNTSTAQGEISYTYNLSPRTALYVGWVKLFNQQYNPNAFNINTYPISTCKFGDSSCTQAQPAGWLLGMAHFF